MNMKEKKKKRLIPSEIPIIWVNIVGTDPDQLAVLL
jgi:hypothetical protein